MLAAANTRPRTAESFRTALLAEHKPEGAVELAFLDTIVEHWQALTEARELKTRMFGNDLEALLFGPDAKKFAKLERHITRCERNFTRAVRDLQNAQSARRRADLAASRKAESEARATAKRAAAEYDMAMMARLCAPIPYANDPHALWRDIEADQRAAAGQSNGAGAVPLASTIQSGKARPSTTAARR